MRSNGIDKLTLRGSGRPNYKILDALTSHLKHIGRIRKYSLAREITLFNGVIIYLYETSFGSYSCCLDLNPNKFYSWNELLLLLKTIFEAGYSSLMIVEIHLNCDLKIDPIRIKAEILPYYFRKIHYIKNSQTWVSGKVSEIRHDLKSTLTIGTKRHKSICVYDLADYRELPPPLTRVEIRWRNSPIFKKVPLDELPSHLSGMDPFVQIGFYSLTRPKTKKPQMLMKFNHFELFTEKYGIKNAKAFFGKYPKAHRVSAYGSIFKSFKRQDYHLRKEWEKGLRGFMKRKARKLFIKEIEGARKRI